MSRVRVEKLLPILFVQLPELLTEQGDNIRAEYKGYIEKTAFAIHQAGIISALTFNIVTKQQDDSKEPLPKKINELIATVLKEFDNTTDWSECKLIDTLREKAEIASEKVYYKDLILDILTAAKLVVRTYNQVKEGNK